MAAFEVAVVQMLVGTKGALQIGAVEEVGVNFPAAS